MVTREILLEISLRRDTDVIKEIIKTHIKSDNVVISDNWAAYNWLSNPGSGYYHHVHTHRHGNFGAGSDSTSHIEQLWAQLKNIIKNIYHTIPIENFILFLRESEIRRNIILLCFRQKMG